MALITTIDEVKKVLRISNLDLDDSIPDMATTQETRLTPFLGDAFSDELQDEYNNAYGTDDEDPAIAALIPRIQRVLAPFAYADNLGTIHAMLTSAGVRRMTTDSMPAVFRWEYDEMKGVLLNQAFAALETLLSFLEKNADDYPTWVSGEGYAGRRSLLIKNGADFSKNFKLHQPYHTYHMLISCMRDVDELYINPLLGAGFYASVKSLDDPEAEDAELIKRLKMAIANLTVAQACDKLPVRIDTNGFTVLSASGDSGSGEKNNAPVANMSALREKALVDGRKYIAGIRNYLNKTASAEVFAGYFASDKYSAPGTKLYGRNNFCSKIFRF